MTGFPLRRAILAGVLASAAVVPMIAPMPAYAQFGGIVYDPTNYAQNVLTAARSLQQINNQIQQIQQQATSLINEARNLASHTSRPVGETEILTTLHGFYQEALRAPPVDWARLKRAATRCRPPLRRHH